jgi:hypothetical protein
VPVSWKILWNLYVQHARYIKHQNVLHGVHHPVVCIKFAFVIISQDSNATRKSTGAFACVFIICGCPAVGVSFISWNILIRHER